MLFLFLQAPLGIAWSWLVAFALMIWCVPALLIRYWPRNGRRLAWQEGHYGACFALLTLGVCSRHESSEAIRYPQRGTLPAK